MLFSVANSTPLKLATLWQKLPEYHVKLTSQNNMKNARMFLFAHFVFGFAHQSSIIFIVSGCVGQFGSGTIHRNCSIWRNMNQSGGIIE